MADAFPDRARQLVVRAIADPGLGIRRQVLRGDERRAVRRPVPAVSSRPATTASPPPVVSHGEWHIAHGARPLVTKYFPRSRLACDGSNRRSVSGRAFGPMNGRMPTIAGVPATRMTARASAVHLRVLCMG
jgi:hypothetical protein